MVLSENDRCRALNGRSSVLDFDLFECHRNILGDSQFERCRNSVDHDGNRRCADRECRYESLGADRCDGLVRRIVAFCAVRGVLGLDGRLTGDIERFPFLQRNAFGQFIGQCDCLHGDFLDREGEVGRFAVDGDRDRRFADCDRRYDAFLADRGRRRD